MLTEMPLKLHENTFFVFASYSLLLKMPFDIKKKNKKMAAVPQL